MSRKGWVYLTLIAFVAAIAIGFIAGGMAIKGDETSPQEEVKPPLNNSNSRTEPDELENGTVVDKPDVEVPSKPAEPEVRVLVPGTQWQTNLYIIKGANPGPKMLVLGGVHGDEKAAFWSGDAASQLRLDSGTLYVIPHFNEVARSKGTREGTGDINRKFPGDINSTDIESRLCGEVSNLIRQERIQMVLTFHEAIGFYVEPPNHPGQTFYYDWDVNPYSSPQVDLTSKALQIINGPAGINARIKACPYFSYQDRELYQVYVQPIETSATYEMMQELGVLYAYGCEVCRNNDANKRVWFHLNALTSWMQLEGFKISNWNDVEARIWRGEFTSYVMDPNDLRAVDTETELVPAAAR